MTQKSALTGVRILDMSRMLPGPYCSMILADHGADVIAIEDRKFQEEGLFFNELNRNKRHMTLNLKSKEGIEIFRRLSSEVDVIIEGFRPGVVKRLGVDYETVKKYNPGIIYCAISGYGQTGPYIDRVGHDVNYLSYAGVLGLIGEKRRPPVIPGVQVADILGGGMNAALGILLALYARGRGGKGQYIDISITDGLLSTLFLPNFFAESNSSQPKPSDGMLSHRYGCYNTYETRDGRFLSIGAVENKFWHKLCAHIKKPEFSRLQYDEKHKDIIIESLRKIFKSKTIAEWEDELSDLEVCYAKVQNLAEVLDDTLFKERQMVFKYSGKDGKKKSSFAVPVKLSSTPGSIRTSPQDFGEATREILLENGYSNEQIDSFIAQGVV